MTGVPHGLLCWLTALLLAVCQGCASFDFLLRADTANAVPARQFLFRDGGQAIYFAFDKHLRQEVSGQPEAAKVRADTFLFVVAGSDCTSMHYFLPDYFRGLEGESGPARIFILQKRFIEERTWGRLWGCSEAFIRADHPQRWIADQTEFIQAQLDAARSQAGLPRRIAIAGISEGGDIVPVLAQRVKGVTHAIIVANGGMNPLDAYRLQAEKHGFAPAQAVLQSLDQAPPADPDEPAQAMAGRSWRYWHELRGLQHAGNLLALQIPLLMAMGDADQAVPVESAFYARDVFVRHNKSNLTLIVYPGADHALRSAGRSYLADFWHAADTFLEK